MHIEWNGNGNHLISPQSLIECGDINYYISAIILIEKMRTFKFMCFKVDCKSSQIWIQVAAEGCA